MNVAAPRFDQQDSAFGVGGHVNLDVVAARVLEPGGFWVKFADGLEGTVHFWSTAYRGVFAKLRDPEMFNQLYVNDYFVTWLGDLDLAPDAMYRHIKESGEWVLR
jgi:hypothetical protein